MHQQFKVERQADGTYAILTGASGGTSGLDVYDWSNEPGGNVNQWNYWVAPAKSGYWSRRISVGVTKKD